MLELQFNHINTRSNRSDIEGFDLPKSVHDSKPKRESYVTPVATINNKYNNLFIVSYKNLNKFESL